MQQKRLTRRGFIQSAAVLAAASVLPVRARGQAVKNRLEWHEFRESSSYAGYLNAIRLMRLNTNSGDRRSWAYWTNIHINVCPHGVPYFLAWHRGYLHHFQHVLRELSGNSALVIPYWDYYKNPELPTEFTDPAGDNPLYVTGRKSTTVYASLTLSPFMSRYTNFQRGTADAFEPVIETGPHGTLHNIIGGAMAGMSSPMDPVFWLHHAQIDRLWAAWAAAGAGRQMPPAGDAYWSGYHTYTSILKMARNMTYDTTTRLYYDYQDKSVPTSLPPLAPPVTPPLASPIAHLTASHPDAPGARRISRPPVGAFQPAAPRAMEKRRSIGGARSITLDENPLTAQVHLEAEDAGLLRSIVEPRSEVSSAGKATRYQYAHLVLDMPRTIGAGGEGGYFYDIYLNLPESDGVDADQLLVGRFGPFEIASRAHHGDDRRLSFPLMAVLQGSDRTDLRDLTISFIRRNGSDSPRGPVVTVNEVRIELSNEPGG